MTVHDHSIRKEGQVPQPHHDTPAGEAREQASTADAREHAPTQETDQEVPVGDGHEELGETTTPQPDVDATDVEGGALSGAEHVATVEADDADEDPRTRHQLLADLRAAEAARGEYLDALQRIQADFQNFRKRSMRDGALQRDEGVAQVLRRLIDVLDDFQLAVLAAENAREVDSLRKGVELVYGKFVDALHSFGLEPIDVEGVPFDPERHEAVQHVTDGEGREQPVVAEVLRPGYVVNDKVLRAAMVKVVQ